MLPRVVHFWHRLRDRRARFTFIFSILYLLLLSIIIHRLVRPDFRPVEMALYFGLLGLLWVLLLEEALYGFFTRDAHLPAWRRALPLLVVFFLPPMRMGMCGDGRPNTIWLPYLGWRQRNRELSRRLAHYFNLPLIVLALMTLPLLGIEYGLGEEVRRQHFGIELALDLSASLIWLAFSFEFILMVSVVDKPLNYGARNWIDLIIVGLPLFDMLLVLTVKAGIAEFGPLLRFTKMLRLDQLARFSRVYRLRGLTAKAWRAIVALRIVQLLTHRTPEKRLQFLRDELAIKEEEMAEIRQEIAKVEAKIAERKAEGVRAEDAVPRMTWPAEPANPNHGSHG